MIFIYENFSSYAKGYNNLNAFILWIIAFEGKMTGFELKDKR